MKELKKYLNNKKIKRIIGSDRKMIIGYETEYNKILNKVFEKERELYKKVIDSKGPLETFENEKKLKDFTSKVMEALTEVIE